MSLGNNIRMRRTALGYTVEELARRLGVSRQTVFRYENGQIATVPSEKLRLLSEVLGTTPAVLMSGEPEGLERLPVPPVRRLPRLDRVVGDRMVLAADVPVSLASGTQNAEPDFSYTVKGDEMTGARIVAGDTVFLTKQDCVTNGEIALVSVNGEVSLRRVYHNQIEGKLILTAENPEVAPLVFLGEETVAVKILGKAIFFQSSIR